jgi:hypothetical protein
LGGFSTVGLLIKGGLSRSMVSPHSLFAEASTGMPEIMKLFVSVCTEQQRSKMLAAASFAFRETAHDKLLLRA